MNREEELQRRVETLEERLRQSEKELENFLYTISHDLRGPLRAILSSSMIVIEDFGDQIGPDGRRELERGSRAARKLNGLVEDVLKISRFGRQAMEPVPLDLTAVVREVAASAAPAAEVTVEEGLTATADPQLVRTLLKSLFENCVKFAQPGEKLQIEVGRQGDAFFVRDNGIGFEPEAAERIFKPFERLHPEDEYPGSGMGLSYVNSAARRHGGKTWAEGWPKQGATFYFTLAEAA